MKIFLIAEIGINHNGDLKTAKKLSFKPLPKPKQSKPPNTAQQSTNTKYNNPQTKTASTGADFVSRQAKLKAIQPQKPIA